MLLSRHLCFLCRDELATLKGETMTNVTGLQQSLKEEQAARSGSDSSNLDVRDSCF